MNGILLPRNAISFSHLFPPSLDHRLPLWANGFRNGGFSLPGLLRPSSSSSLFSHLATPVSLWRSHVLKTARTVRPRCGGLTRSLDDENVNRHYVCVSVYVYVRVCEAGIAERCHTTTGVCSVRFRSRPFAAELTVPLRQRPP